MTYPGLMRVFALLVCALAAAGCERGQQPDRSAATGTPAAQSQAEPAQEPVKLEEVLEITPQYVIGISYPEGEVRHPQLAAEMKRYAEEQRAQFMEAVNARAQGDGQDAMLYDLSLRFSEILDSPELAAYAVDGSSFTGGAHGTVLMERFVWLPEQGERLAIAELLPTREGRVAIADYVREQLHTALSQRVDADEISPAERSQVISSAGRMIDEGTTPEPENFEAFEPMVNRAGKLTGLRFVFPPYQVGPYADGMQTVEVPASVLMPHIARDYRDLFVAG